MVRADVSLLQSDDAFANPFLSARDFSAPGEAEFLPRSEPEVVSVEVFEDQRNDDGRPALAPNSITFPDKSGGGIDFSQGVRRADGKICILKESTVKSIQKDPILECKHQNLEKCHYTYVTFFKPTQEEICEENFEKTCQITFKKQATTETVKKCYRPLIKTCNGQGPEECRTVYESSCQTRYIQKPNGTVKPDHRNLRLIDTF